MDKQQREYIHHLMLQYSDAMVRLTYRRVSYVISGQISEAEIKEMINSIQ